MNRKELSKIRKAASKLAIAARWGGRTEKATACVRLYPTTAAEVRRLASERGELPADVVAALLPRV